ncbi:hypothetical protein [Methanospirillum sp.]
MSTAGTRSGGRRRTGIEEGFFLPRTAAYIRPGYIRTQGERRGQSGTVCTR